jgi:adenylate kinase family enzyme
MRRLAVVGVTGSGKTTLAAELARRLDVAHIELDSIYWQAGWTPLTQEACRAQVSKRLAGGGWVTDGNYNFLSDLIWARADTLVWLDYALPLILWRLTVRTFQRVGQRRVLWQGNTESWRTQFFSRESLYLWALQSYPKLRKRYASLTEQPGYRQLNVIRLRTPREAERWLRSLAPGGSAAMKAAATGWQR